MFTFHYSYSVAINKLPTPVAPQSKTRVCCRWIPGVAGSNLVRGMGVSLSCDCCVCCQLEVSVTSWSLVQKSHMGFVCVYVFVCVCVCVSLNVISKPQPVGQAPLGLSSHEKIFKNSWFLNFIFCSYEYLCVYTHTYTHTHTHIHIYISCPLFATNFSTLTSLSCWSFLSKCHHTWRVKLGTEIVQINMSTVCCYKVRYERNWRWLSWRRYFSPWAETEASCGLTGHWALSWHT